VLSRGRPRLSFDEVREAESVDRTFPASIGADGEGPTLAARR